RAVGLAEEHASLMRLKQLLNLQAQMRHHLAHGNVPKLEMRLGEMERLGVMEEPLLAGQAAEAAALLAEQGAAVERNGGRGKVAMDEGEMMDIAEQILEATAAEDMQMLKQVLRRASNLKHVGQIHKQVLNKIWFTMKRLHQAEKQAEGIFVAADMWHWDLLRVRVEENSSLLKTIQQQQDYLPRPGQKRFGSLADACFHGRRALKALQVGVMIESGQSTNGDGRQGTQMQTDRAVHLDNMTPDRTVDRAAPVPARCWRHTDRSGVEVNFNVYLLRGGALLFCFHC
ncbi:hypothetical protein CYMTET_8439, partial [Cymbomonas tetramitiformis]